MLCPVCGEKELKGKQTVCSPTCRKKRQRDNQGRNEGTPAPKTEEPSNGVIHNVPASIDELTDTDLDFQAEYQAVMADVRPDLDMRFGALRKGVACRTCGVKFDTHLPLARFCSVDCKNEALNHLSGQK